MSLKGLDAFDPGCRIKVELQWIAGHLAGVIAPNRPGCGVARIRELRFPTFRTPCVEFVKSRLGDQHLPAHFEQLGNLTLG